MAEPVLQVKSLVKYFGALCATDHVSLDVRAGEIHALIGPNGAGKTSLVAQLSGLLASDSGEVVFMNQNISALSAHQRVRLGMVRSFQITRLFKSFTVRDNVALAVQARTGNPYSFWGLKSRVAILLVEHDMDAVFRLADRISVMVNGAVIACGEPQAIRSDPMVIAAYLGEEHSA